MKIFLDDVRKAPEGFILLKTCKATITMLMMHDIEVLSLDHDLGTKDTGYDVLLWIEQAVALARYNPPKLLVHSANPVGRDKMFQAIKSIERLLTERDS